MYLFAQQRVKMMHWQTDGQTYRGLYLQDGHSEVPIGPWPLQIYGVNLTRLTPQAHFNPITQYCTNPNLTKHGCTDC